MSGRGVRGRALRTQARTHNGECRVSHDSAQLSCSAHGYLQSRIFERLLLGFPSHPSERRNGVGRVEERVSSAPTWTLGLGSVVGHTNHPNLSSACRVLPLFLLHPLS